MVDEAPDVVTMLHGIAATAARFDTELTAPEGVLRQGLYDILRIYGLASQLSEVVQIQHDQILALTDVVGMLLGRMIEHDRRAIHTATAINLGLDLLQKMAPVDIAVAAAEARAVILAEQQAQLIELAAHERQARDRLAAARRSARAVLASEAASESGDGHS